VKRTKRFRPVTALERYLGEIRALPPLGREEEAAIGRMIAGRLDEAAHRLVLSNLRFVTQIAFEYRDRGLPLEDLISEGNMGLLEAAVRFDPHRGIRFITYAAWWVRKAIRIAIERHGSTVRIPSYQYRKAAGADTAPPPAARCRTVSLDEPSAGDGSPAPADTLPDPRRIDPESEASRREHIRLLVRLWRHLDPREQEVLILRYGLSGDAQRTLGQVGADLGLSRERVRQIQSGAIGKLRSIIARPGGCRRESQAALGDESH